MSTGRPAGGGPVGTATPLGCRVGRSECGGARTEDAAGKTGGWLLDGARPVAAPALAPAGTVLAGDLAITQTSDGAVVARDPVTGREAWRATPGPGRVVAAQPGRVHVLTEDYWLVTLDPGTGVERSRFLFTYGRERLGWTPGHAYADGGFLLVERLAAGAGPADRDGDYYFIAQ
ncbi:MAG TPA: pyrrolo-quinoline quinone, partial [Micromonosporaceae bacterium]|nr:pyrrolo-quinoline quinone [Micromonosporaceae bacterium]